MKKLIVFCVALCLATGTIAQAIENNPQNPNQKLPREQKENKNCYLMKDGKVWEVKDNKSVALTAEVVLKNGTRIKPEGTVITKSGEITILNEGDKIYESGQIEKSSSKKEMGSKLKM